VARDQDLLSKLEDVIVIDIDRFALTPSK